MQKIAYHNDALVCLKEGIANFLVRGAFLSELTKFGQLLGHQKQYTTSRYTNSASFLFDFIAMKIVRKFGRSPAHRKMMMRNLVTALIREDQIKTTLEKAKELRRHAEHMVALAKRGNNIRPQFRSFPNLSNCF